MCRRSRATACGTWTTGPTRNATRGRRSSASSPRARPGPTPACASANRTPAWSSAAAAAASTSASGSTSTSFVERGKKVTPYAIPVSIVGMVSSEISISLRLHGISHVLSCGCTSSTDAIGYAAALIRSGEADVILSGGTDACVTPGMIFGFSRMKVVSTAYNERPAEASRPFDRGRDGFVLGEGAWMIVLEREDRARARGAKIYASIDGYGVDLRRVSPRADGAGRRGNRPGDLDRHRTIRPPPRGDRLRQLSRHRRRSSTTPSNRGACARCSATTPSAWPGSSIKSMIGHPQGASGAAGVVASALAISRGFLPPTINLTDPDPACDLDFVPNQGRRRRSRPRSATASASGPRTAPSWSAGHDGMTDRYRRRCGPGRHCRRHRRWPGPARACGCSIARASRATSCAATPSTQARSRCCGA